MATTWTSIYKTGQGWTYNQADLTYNQTILPQTGLPLLYNSMGEATVWTNLAKP